MKKITINGVNYGAYNTIEVLDDRYRCDGADLPFSVVGQGVISDTVDGDFPPAISLDELKANKIDTIISSTDLFVPVILNGITYNGGADSAGKIKGAIDLAQLLLEPTVDIWDINDKTRTYSFPDAMDIVSAIAIDYRTKALARQARITAVNDIVVDVNGTYPTLADALAAINLI